MKRIVLSGYYGFQNAGDEAILEATVALLRSKCPGVQITVLSADPAQTLRCYGVDAVQRTSIPAVLQALRRADLLVSGGGGLLQDVTGWRTVPYYLGIMKMAMLLGTRVAVFAQGIGPLKGALNRSLVKKVLSRVDWLSVRDEDSKLLLQEMGVRGEIVITADPVFTLVPPSLQEVERCLQERGIKRDGDRPLIGISMRRLPRGEESHNNFVSIAREACLYLEKEAGARLVFLPCRQADDLEAGRAVFETLSPGHTIIEENLLPQEMLCLIRGLDLLLGMRLHALIFAAVCGVPFVGLPYDPKVSTFLKMMGTADLSSEGKIAFSRVREELDLSLSRGKDSAQQTIMVRQQSEAVSKAVQQMLRLL